MYDVNQRDITFTRCIVRRKDSEIGTPRRIIVRHWKLEHFQQSSTTYRADACSYSETGVINFISICFVHLGNFFVIAYCWPECFAISVILYLHIHFNAINIFVFFFLLLGDINTEPPQKSHCLFWPITLISHDL